MRISILRAAMVVLAGCSVVLLAGCAGMEHVPNGQYLLYHRELPAATRAIEEARGAGRDKECPSDFQAAEKLKNEAYALYHACRTQEAIAKANEAIARAAALCPKVAEAPKPPAPAPPAAPAPSVSLSAASASVDQGGCTDLTWSTSNAQSASIDQGIGSVELSGSKSVCPTATTQYTLTASGEGGTRTESTTITVRPRAPEAPIDRLTIHVNFDTDKAEIRKADLAELQKAAAFVAKYPGCKISVRGYTDSQGSEAYNQALSERRAASVRAYLVENGATREDRITSEGRGESDPVGDNATAEGRFENRRVEVVILSR
jgi:outer membrane protein OmpA-like peptidoglycan-associated protein